MAHPSHPVLVDGFEKLSDSRPKLSEAFYTVKTFVKTASFNAVFTEGTHYLADATSGVLTVTLPDPALAKEQRFSVIKTDVSTNAVSVTSAGPSGTGDINGASSKSLPNQFDSAVFYNDGVNWFIE